VVLNSARFLFETNSGNKYILVVIDHYLIWVEAKSVAKCGTNFLARFLEDEILCRFGVPKHVLLDNQGEWAT
jgi:hypothetical protein